jgi:hypothetical protein
MARTCPRVRSHYLTNTLSSEPELHAQEAQIQIGHHIMHTAKTRVHIKVYELPALVIMVFLFFGWVTLGAMTNEIVPKENQDFSVP